MDKIQTKENKVILGYSEGQKTTGLFHKFFIFPPLQATTFNFWPSFLASYMGPQYKIVYSITLRGYFVLDGQGYTPFHPPTLSHPHSNFVRMTLLTKA